MRQAATNTSLQSAPAGKRDRSARWELVAVLLAALLAYILAHRFDLFEYLLIWGDRWEGKGIGPLVITALILVPAALLYGWRRARAQSRIATAYAQSASHLRHERDFSEAILTTAGSLILLLDRQGYIIRFNRACEVLTGYRLAEVQHRPFWEFLLLPDEADRVRRVFAELRAGRYPNKHENHWVTRDGERRLIAWTNTALLDATGEVAHIIATGIDVTEQRATESSLHETIGRLRLLQQQLPGYLWTTDRALRLTTFTGGGFAGREGEIASRVGKTVPEFFRNDDPAYPPVVAHRRALAGESSTYEVTVSGRDYAVYVEPLRDVDGTIAGCQGLGVDMTARKAAEDALRASEARFRAIFEHAAIGIVVGGLDRRILQANPAYERLLGYTTTELGAMPFPSLTYREDATIDTRNFRTLVAGERESYQVEKRYRRRDGGEVWGRLTVSLVRDASGAPQYTIGMVEDITAHKAAERGLLVARRRLTTAREEERLALARELHDEAIQEILGTRLALQLARRAVESSDGNSELATLLTEAEHTLADIVGRLRRVVSGLRPAGLEELGLIAAIEGYIAHARRKGAGAPVSIESDLDPAGNELDAATARAFFRVAQEGLRNVHRHSGARRARLVLRVRATEAILRVVDDGVGFIPPADLAALARADHFGLVGLGEQLSDVGGTLKIRSRPGAGTTLMARVPLRAGYDADA